MSKPSDFSLEKLIRPNILKLQPYRCARDDYSAGILLDANENALGPSLSATIESNGKPNGNHEEQDDYAELQLNRYPDPVQGEIKQKFADFRGFKHGSSGTFLGVGSDEIIDLLIRITCKPGEDVGDAILVCPPTYGMYSVCAAVSDVHVIKCPLDAENGRFLPRIDEISGILSSPQGDRIKLVFLTSPGNPTGTCIPNDLVRPLLDHPTWRGLVVLDEAYIDFTDKPSAVALFQEGYRNLVVMQTMSKGFGLAGIRMGISFQSPELAQILANTKAPYSIGTPTADIALRALTKKNLQGVRDKSAQLIENRAWLLETLKHEFPRDIGPALGANDANFVLIPIYSKSGPPTLDNRRSAAIYKSLAEEKGVVIRYRGNEVGCEACVRITIGSKSECQAVIEKLREVFSEM